MSSPTDPCPDCSHPLDKHTNSGLCVYCIHPSSHVLIRPVGVTLCPTQVGSTVHTDEMYAEIVSEFGAVEAQSSGITQPISVTPVIPIIPTVGQ